MLDRLKYLADGYFHEDYDLVSGSPLDVIRDFVKQESPSIRHELIGDIETALANYDEPAIGELWSDRWQASYEPIDDGLSYHEWFEKVLEVLRGSD